MHTIISDQDVLHFFKFFILFSISKVQSKSSKRLNLNVFEQPSSNNRLKTLLVSFPLYKCPFYDGLLIDVFLFFLSIDCLYNNGSLYQLKCMVKQQMRKNVILNHEIICFPSFVMITKYTYTVLYIYKKQMFYSTFSPGRSA